MVIRVNDLNVAYDDCGPAGAPVILFLHAFPLNRSMWRPQLDFFAETHRCIALDLRGHGETTYVGKPLGAGQVSMSLLADDAAALLATLDIPQAAVCGLSLGGYVSFALWRRHPHHIGKLILADTKAQPDNAEQKANRMKQADLARAEGLRPVADGMLPKLIAPQHEHTVLDFAVRHMIQGTRVAEIVPTLHALADRPDSQPTLPTIDVPTLILVGEQDALTPVKDAELVQKGIGPLAQLVVIHSAGHLSNLEQPPAFNFALRRFLG
jgi:3-oxoadipate enol-lactonase